MSTPFLAKYAIPMIQLIGGLGVLIPAATGAVQLQEYVGKKSDEHKYANSSYWAEVVFCIIGALLAGGGAGYMLYIYHENKKNSFISGQKKLASVIKDNPVDL